MASRLRAVPETPPRAVAYIRVSKEREDMISPELQETSIRDYCARNGYDLVEILEPDLDKTGRLWKSRKIETAVQMIERGDVEVIVVWKISRVSRNRLDWNIAVDRVETAGGRLESATEAIDTTTSAGRFSRGMLAELAAFESERTGEQWQETHRRLWKNGRPHSGKPRFGYTYTREHGFVPNPETAPLVREMYRRYEQGEGLQRIADWLVSLGRTEITTGHGVAYFLRSPFSAGYLQHHDPECRLAHRAKKPCPNQVREIGGHEPIVTLAEYERFMAAASDRATLPARLVSPVSTLSGIMFCSGCGHRMSRKSARARREYPYFRCVDRACTSPISFKEAKAEQLVLDWLPTVAAELEKSRRIRGSAVEATERDALARVVTRAENALAKLTVDYARGDVPDTAYRGARDALVKERDDAARQHAALAGTAAASAVAVKVAARLLDDWAAMNPEQRNRLLRELCTVTVSKGEKRPEAVVRGLWE